MTRSELMARVAARKSAIESEKADLQGQLSALREKFERLKARVYWAEIDNGAQVTAGTECQYMLKDYRATKDHKKSLLDTPRNSENWEEIQ